MKRALVPVGEAWESEPQEPPKARPKPSAEPWRLYDAYVQGASIFECARRANVDESQVESDIEAMRNATRERHELPGLRDAECDELRSIFLLTQGCVAEGTGAAIKVNADLQVRRAMIVRLAQDREETPI